jgi:hypothetical protein
MGASLFYTKHDRGLTVFAEGKSSTVSNSHPNYAEILDALKARDFATARRLKAIGDTINEAVKKVEAKTGKKARIYVENGEVRFRDLKGKVTALKGVLVDRILNALRAGKTEESIKPLILFLDNVMKNKLKDIREELYLFLMSGKLPITTDGHFLAYKKVRDDFKDIYTGKMDNSPGKLVSMPSTETVDTDRHRTCSHGLHFCTWSYLSSYGSSGNNRVVIVKVNPRFVFAIPSDYNNAKGRASEYFVVGECKSNNEAFVKDMIFDEDTPATPAADEVKPSKPTKGKSKAKADKTPVEPKKPSIKKASGKSKVKQVDPGLQAVAPTVKFIPDTKPTLKAMIEGYGLLNENGLVYVQVEDAKGPFKADHYKVVIKRDDKFFYVGSTAAKGVSPKYVKEMASSTKSVRSALVRAVAKARHR